MTATQRVMPGERDFSMPPGSLPRSGGELITRPSEERDAAATRRNPVAASADSVQKGGELYIDLLHALPRGVRPRATARSSTKFVPPADLTNPELHKVRTDGYWQSYLSAGGAVMPSYAEALSSEERWHVVNFLRTLAKK